MNHYTTHPFHYPGHTLFPLLFLICLLCCSAAFAAEENSTPPLCTGITATLAPNLRSILFNSVAVMPFHTDDPQLGANLSDAFYTALLKTNKYQLAPTSSVAQWLEKNSNPSTKLDLQEQAIALGRSLKARGVIQSVLLPRWETFRTNREVSNLLEFNIRMTDTQTGKMAWNLSAECSGREHNRLLPPELLSRIMDRNLEKLLSRMVEAGDIFSSVLPKPTVLSARGELRTVRVVLQPDPPSTYAAYQLLAADTGDGVFLVHSPRVTNDHAPIILEDSGLEDGKTYYYTVIGLTENGLANVPEPPFAVTTSGAPNPLDYLQASGNNLRQIRLFWPISQDPDVTGYKLYRSTSPDGPFQAIATIDDRKQQSFIDYGSDRSSSYGSLADDSLYYYTIRTRNRLGIESRNTPVVAARTKGAPMPPTEIQAFARQPKKIPLFWTPGDDPDIRGYAVLRSDSEQGPFRQIDFVRGRESQEYTDSGSWNTPLLDDTTYFYRLRSVNVLEMSSEDSATVSATTKPAPATVAGVQVTDNLFRKVDLRWQANPEIDITGYEILRGETRDDLRTIATVDVADTSYTDSGLRDGSTYWYQLRAVDKDQLQGNFSETVVARTKPKPSAPAGLSATLIEQGILLQWQGNPETDIEYYEIFTTGFLGSKVGETPATSFVYSEGLEPGGRYRFQVRVVDSDGLTGAYSRPVVITIPAEKE